MRHYHAINESLEAADRDGQTYAVRADAVAMLEVWLSIVKEYKFKSVPEGNGWRVFEADGQRSYYLGIRPCTRSTCTVARTR